MILLHYLKIKNDELNKKFNDFVKKNSQILKNIFRRFRHKIISMTYKDFIKSLDDFILAHKKSLKEIEIEMIKRFYLTCHIDVIQLLSIIYTILIILQERFTNFSEFLDFIQKNSIRDIKTELERLGIIKYHIDNIIYLAKKIHIYINFPNLYLKQFVETYEKKLSQIFSTFALQETRPARDLELFLDNLKTKVGMKKFLDEHKDFLKRFYPIDYPIFHELSLKLNQNQGIVHPLRSDLPQIFQSDQNLRQNFHTFQNFQRLYRMDNTILDFFKDRTSSSTVAAVQDDDLSVSVLVHGTRYNPRYRLTDIDVPRDEDCSTVAGVQDFPQQLYDIFRSKPILNQIYGNFHNFYESYKEDPNILTDIDVPRDEEHSTVAGVQDDELSMSAFVDGRIYHPRSGLIDKRSSIQQLHRMTPQEIYDITFQQKMKHMDYNSDQILKDFHEFLEKNKAILELLYNQSYKRRPDCQYRDFIDFYNQLKTNPISTLNSLINENITIDFNLRYPKLVSDLKYFFIIYPRFKYLILNSKIFSYSQFKSYFEQEFSRFNELLLNPYKSIEEFSSTTELKRRLLETLKHKELSSQHRSLLQEYYSRISLGREFSNLKRLILRKYPSLKDIIDQIINNPFAFKRITSSIRYQDDDYKKLLTLIEKATQLSKYIYK
jgi:hypothetical protein